MYFQHGFYISFALHLQFLHDLYILLIIYTKFHLRTRSCGLTGDLWSCSREIRVCWSALTQRSHRVIISNHIYDIVYIHRSTRTGHLELTCGDSADHRMRDVTTVCTKWPPSRALARIRDVSQGCFDRITSDINACMLKCARARHGLSWLQLSCHQNVIKTSLFLRGSYVDFQFSSVVVIEQLSHVTWINFRFVKYWPKKDVGGK